MTSATGGRHRAKRELNEGKEMSYEAVISMDLDGEQVAGAFWALSAEQQADFFAALESMAGFRLCIQMAATVDEIRKRSDRGDRDAMNGFRTMLSHAEAYAKSATEYRVWEAQRHLASLTPTQESK